MPSIFISNFAQKHFEMILDSKLNFYIKYDTNTTRKLRFFVINPFKSLPRMGLGYGYGNYDQLDNFSNVSQNR